MRTEVILLNTKEKLFNALLETGNLCTELQSNTLFEVFEELEICVGIDQFQNLYKVNNEYLDEETYCYLDIKEYCREECFIELLEDALFYLEADKEDDFKSYQDSMAILKNSALNDKLKNLHLNAAKEHEENLFKTFNKIDIISETLYSRKDKELTYVTALSINGVLIEENHFDNLEDAINKKNLLEKSIRSKYIVNEVTTNINTNIDNVLSFVNNPKIKTLKNDVTNYDICTYFKVVGE